jgi:hypothetical protein
MRRAEASGQDALAYLLECALIEVRHVAEQEQRDRAEQETDPRDLWRSTGA